MIDKLYHPMKLHVIQIKILYIKIYMYLTFAEKEFDL